MKEASGARKYNVFLSADQRGLSAHFCRRGIRVHGRSGGPSLEVTPKLAPSVHLRTTSNSSQRESGEYCPSHNACDFALSTTRECSAVGFSLTGDMIIAS